SHAAGTRGGDCLAILLVHHVATGEHARHAGLGRAGLDRDIAVVVKVDMAAEQLGRRMVADRDEAAIDVDLRKFAGQHVLELDRHQALGLAAADEPLDLLVPEDVDPLVGEQALLQDLLGPERIAAVDHG
ncbi:hypothetical protein QU38_00235, partial [Staphylococcus aureus]